jgi:O-antigen/teichoic acid export membrane protein
MIRSTLPGDVNLYVLYYINLAATVLSYWLFAYKNSVLAAHQRNDISNKITICVNVTLYLTQFVLLVYLKNYYVYLLLALLSQILINIITAFASDKMFPQYSPKGKLKKEEVTIINRKVRDLFTAKLGGTITNSADSIVISAFLGLTVLAIYNNYFYIVSSIIGFATIGNYALMAGIGNSIVTESKSKNYNDFRNITHVYMFAICICTSCFLNLFQPFMKMWMGEKRMLDMGAVICLCIYFIVYEVNAVLNLYKDAAGIWHQDRFRPLVVSLINLCLNLATVKKIGIYGVILSTVVSIMFVGIPWVTKNLFNNIFEKKKMKKFAIKLVIYLLEIVLISSLSYLLCNMVTQKGIIEMILKLILSVVISLGGFVILNYKTDEFKEAKIILSKVIKG